MTELLTIWGALIIESPDILYKVLAAVGIWWMIRFITKYKEMGS